MPSGCESEASSDTPVSLPSCGLYHRCQQMDAPCYCTAVANHVLHTRKQIFNIPDTSDMLPFWPLCHVCTSDMAMRAIDMQRNSSDS